MDRRPSPGIKGTVNPKFPGLNYQIAPVEGFDIARFVAEAKQGESTWDVYVGMTPFVEMSQLIQADVIEPWDHYIPKEVIDDIIPSIREECTVDGKLYSWPFLLDVIVEAQNNALISKAGLPDKIPADWDEYLRQPRRSSIRAPRRTAAPSTPMAGARWPRSRTASAPTAGICSKATSPVCRSSTSPASPPSRR